MKISNWSLLNKPRIAKHGGKWFVSAGVWVGFKSDTIEGAWREWEKLTAVALVEAKVENLLRLAR